jgi:hypothetical protein
MIRCQKKAINDISHALEDAIKLAGRIKHVRRSERVIYNAFTSLAGDEKVGLLAYIIWRSRSV